MRRYSLRDRGHVKVPKVPTRSAHTPGAMPSDADPVDAIAHFANGRVKFTGLRLDGEMHGDWTFYRTDGSVMRTGSFDRGRQVGTWRIYDRAGKVLKEQSFAWVVLEVRGTLAPGGR